MRLLPAAVLGLLILPSLAQAQTSSRSVLLPPNPIDRATSASDQRNADARRAAEADRRAADAAGRTAASKTGPIPNSTMTDTAGGFTATQETGSPVTPDTAPPRF